MAMNRRKFLARSLVVGGGALTFHQALTQVQAATDAKPDTAPLQEGSVVLFQGDSITDAGRNKKRNGPNGFDSLGRGYPSLCGGSLLARNPELKLKVYNRGISGNKVPDLDARWPQDALDLKPAVLSILIGVNDIWHKLNGKYSGTVADYETGYRALLERTLKALPDTRILLCEPFVLRCGAVKGHWFPEFSQRLAAARKLADEFNLTRVPFQEVFDEAVKSAPPAYWANDGVHPTLAGHALMAEAWQRSTGL